MIQVNELEGTFAANLMELSLVFLKIWSFETIHCTKIDMNMQYNLSYPACYQTEKKIRIRQGTGIERLTYPRDIKVTLISIQHTVDNGYVNELYTLIYSRLKELF